MFVLKSTFNREKNRADNMQGLYNELVAQFYRTLHRQAELEQTLQDIVAQKTEKPNATVSRIVKLAEEVLAEGVRE